MVPRLDGSNDQKQAKQNEVNRIIWWQTKHLLKKMNSKVARCKELSFYDLKSWEAYKIDINTNETESLKSMTYTCNCIVW